MKKTNYKKLMTKNAMAAAIVFRIARKERLKLLTERRGF